MATGWWKQRNLSRKDTIPVGVLLLVFCLTAIDYSPLLTRTNLAVALIQQGQLDQAIEELRNILQRAPAHPLALYNLGVAYQQKGWNAKAIESYRTLLNLYPDDIEARVNLGILYRKEGQLDQAIREFQHAITLHPHLPLPYLHLGFAYAEKGWKEKAEEILTRYESLSQASSEDRRRRLRAQ